MRSTAAFTLVEAVIAVVLLGLLVGIGMPALLGIRNQGIENAKGANAARLTALACAALQANCTVGAGASNNIDTTTATTAVTCLVTGFTINGVTYKLVPGGVTPASYTFSVAPTATQVIFGFNVGPSFVP